MNLDQKDNEGASPQIKAKWYTWLHTSPKSNKLCESVYLCSRLEKVHTPNKILYLSFIVGANMWPLNDVEANLDYTVRGMRMIVKVLFSKYKYL